MIKSDDFTSTKFSNAPKVEEKEIIFIHLKEV